MNNLASKIFCFAGISAAVYLASYACSKQVKEMRARTIYTTCIKNYKKAVADRENACSKIKELYVIETIDYNAAIKYAKSMPEYVASPHFTF